MKIFEIITIFPEFFESPLKTSLMGKAIDSGIMKIELNDLKSYSEDNFHRVDDYSYGGGSGMVLKTEPLSKAIEFAGDRKRKIVLTSPAGVLLTQDIVKELSEEDNISIICGHYEGIDQRIVDKYVDYELSIGDYIVSGGEYAALVIIDAIARYIPGFMSNPDSLNEESFESNLLEYPHYTRPDEIDGMKVPDILLSGDHGKIKKWRLEKSIEKTKKVRPDLYKKYLKSNTEGE